jgi:hypothetical protein
VASPHPPSEVTLLPLLSRVHDAPSRIGRGGAEDPGPALEGKAPSSPFPVPGAEVQCSSPPAGHGPVAQGVELVELATVPSKRQSLIPFPRVGRSLQPARSAFHRRLLRSASSEFKRRITRSPASARLAFGRRITRAGPAWATVAPERILQKRQSLIPFPRTGKRSGASTAAPGEQERDQVVRVGGASSSSPPSRSMFTRVMRRTRRRCPRGRLMRRKREGEVAWPGQALYISRPFWGCTDRSVYKSALRQRNAWPRLEGSPVRKQGLLHAVHNVDVPPCPDLHYTPLPPRPWRGAAGQGAGLGSSSAR